MNARLDAAVEMLRTKGYLDEQTLQSLSQDEFQLVLERANAGVN
jgi:hypothetical protein